MIKLGITFFIQQCKLYEITDILEMEGLLDITSPVYSKVLKKQS